MHLLVVMVSLGVAAGTAAFTITKTTITQGFRTWVTKKNQWFGKLFNCPNCLSHWLCAIAVLLYRPDFLDLWVGIDLGVSWLVMVFIAALTWGTIMRQMKTLVA